MFKYILLIFFVINSIKLFCDDSKPVVKYNTISLKNKFVSTKHMRINNQIRKISKLTSMQEVFISYDNGVTWIKQNENDFISYPNPSYTKEISFNISKKINDFKSLKIYDIQGNIVQYYKYCEQNGIITIYDLKEGNYFLQIISEKSSNTIPFIIK